MEKRYSSTKKPPKTTALSTRAMAAKVILQVLDEGKSLSTLIPEAQSSVKAQDLPLLQEICFGVCRVLPRLEQIIKRLVDKPKRALCIVCYWSVYISCFICESLRTLR